VLNDFSLAINTESVAATLEAFLREQIGALHRDGAVIGLSGGIDSSVSATLAVRALGKDRVLGLILPERDNSSLSKRYAVGLARQLGIRCEIRKISRALNALGVYNSFWRHLVPYRIRARMAQDRIKAQQKETGQSSFEENLLSLKTDAMRQAASRYRCKPRIRMVALYSAAERHNYMVVGTTNRSEYLIGFFTRYGDGAADVDPIVPLYKTQVRQLARHLDLPEAIIRKVPAGDAVPGVTDELRIGLPFEALDKVLYGCEKGLPDGEIAAGADVGHATVAYVRRLMRDSAYRRAQPVIPTRVFSTP